MTSFSIEKSEVKFGANKGVSDVIGCFGIEIIAGGMNTEELRCNRTEWNGPTLTVETRMWADAQRDGRPRNIDNDNVDNDEERKFRNSIPCTTPQSLADAHCSSAVQ